MDSQTLLLSGKEDKYNGVVVNLSETMDVGTFAKTLSYSLKPWKHQVLVVQETGGTLKGTGVWKLHTGIINEGEGIWAGAIKVVEEETDIKTQFVGVLAFREIHQSFMQRKTSIYFLCELEPSTFEIKKQDSEILDAKWMPIEDYINQPFNQEKEMYKFMANIYLKRSQEKKNYAGFSTVVSKTLTGKESYLYCRTDHTGLVNRKKA